ncbi:MAG: hypothetical protein IJY36_04035 [Coprobacter sp.]|nr:hypothetical protein [Coprobacter sp.]
MSKYYYIPTSSLNLETILQSESISPSSFYPQRIVGSKTFEQITQYADVKNAVILLERPIRFAIEDTERYNFPILIELSNEKQINEDLLSNVGMGVYAYTGTINLTPKNCRIIFFEKTHRNTTISTIKDNREIKYYNDYIIVEWNTSVKNLPILPIGATDHLKKANSDEMLTDKIKGLLYANMLGQSMCLTPDLARLCKITQDIYNILHTLQLSPYSLNDYKNRLELLLEEFKKILTRWGVWDICVNKHTGYKPFPIISSLKAARDFEDLKNDVISRRDKAIRNYQESRPKPNVESIVINENNVSFSDKSYITGVIKYIINNNITPDKLSADRRYRCGEIGKEVIKPIYKKYHSDKWTNSEERIYFTKLYKFLNEEDSSFDVRSNNNEELQAIAAFIYAGNDFAELTNYLRTNELCNYSYVLSLWGVLCGYMSMSKDILHSLLSIETYKMIYRKMWGYSMCEAGFLDLPKETYNNQDITTPDENNIPFNPVGNRVEYKGSTPKRYRVDPQNLLFIINTILDSDIKKSHGIKITNLLNKNDIYLPPNDDEICNYIIKEGKIKFNKPDKEDRLKKCITLAIELEKNTVNREVFLQILNKNFNSGNKIYNKLMNRFFPPEKPQTQKLNIL